MEQTKDVKAIVKNISQQLHNFYEGDGWVTWNFNKKILTLSPADAFKKVQGLSHHIAGQVAHLTAWRNFVTEKLSGNSKFDIKDNSTQDWPEPVDWDQVREDFRVSQQRLLDAIAHFPAKNWNGTVPGRNYSFLFMVNGILEHDYYHYGQIGVLLAAIRKIEA
ncbi:MAG: DinB family protein [Bacteroidota bacterium]|nr:DinB family protein [Bacteroidota bacterium]